MQRFSKKLKGWAMFEARVEERRGLRSMKELKRVE